MQEWCYIQTTYPEFIVFFASLLPFLGLKAAIPLGSCLGLPLWESSVLAILGDFIIMIPLVYYLPILIEYFRKHHPKIDLYLKDLFAKTHKKHSAQYETFGALFLIIFISLPLPGTGGWSGLIAAYVLGMKKETTLICILIGLILAALLISGILEGAIRLTA